MQNILTLLKRVGKTSRKSVKRKVHKTAIAKLYQAMSTRSRDQQKKQRQKEFKERKEHQEMLKAAAKNAKRGASENAEESGGKSKDEV